PEPSSERDVLRGRNPIMPWRVRLSNRKWGMSVSCYFWPRDARHLPGRARTDGPAHRPDGPAAQGGLPSLCRREGRLDDDARWRLDGWLLARHVLARRQGDGRRALPTLGARVGGAATAVFWPGMCWLAAKATAGARYRRWALEWAERLRPRATSDTAFRGFLFYYSAVLGAVLFNDPAAREIALDGARHWARTYNPNAGCFPLGDAAEEAADVGQGEASVDTVQGAALLVWAAQAANEPALRELAVG